MELLRTLKIKEATSWSRYWNAKAKGYTGRKLGAFKGWTTRRAKAVAQKVQELKQAKQSAQSLELPRVEAVEEVTSEAVKSVSLSLSAENFEAPEMVAGVEVAGLLINSKTNNNNEENASSEAVKELASQTIQGLEIEAVEGFELVKELNGSSLNSNNSKEAQSSRISAISKVKEVSQYPETSALKGLRVKELAKSQELQQIQKIASKLREWRRSKTREGTSWKVRGSPPETQSLRNCRDSLRSLINNSEGDGWGCALLSLRQYEKNEASAGIR